MSDLSALEPAYPVTYAFLLQVGGIGPTGGVCCQSGFFVAVDMP